MNSDVAKQPDAHSLVAAIDLFVAARMLALAATDDKQAPEDAQIRGQIGALMGLSKIDRREREGEILDAFLTAWIAAGGLPRNVTTKRARVEKRKTKLKQIKTKRAQSAKIAAANQAK